MRIRTVKKIYLKIKKNWLTKHPMNFELLLDVLQVFFIYFSKIMMKAVIDYGIRNDKNFIKKNLKK